ncbi:MAG: excinuclease ABC subunit UvrA [Lachnospiraceae bacterium]|nr:excinuclease ABC subunit UvrA [Lachnospiraceae bacterium]
MSENIKVVDAYENNLKHITIEVPKHKLTVFTGVSGSGKSSLVLDTIAAQSRRELNETFPGFVQNYLPKYGRPHVGHIENLPVAIVIDQKKPSQNQRSTVGTYTDTYTLLRLLFSRCGEPFVGYSDAFSFNHPSGSCPRCDGLGEINELDVHKLVDFDKCLNDPGVINYVAFEPGQWRWIRYANSGLFDLNKKIKDYTEEELELFLNSPQIKLKNPPEGWPKSAKYEGLVHRMYRSVLKSDEGKLHREILDPMTNRGICPDCGGTRLNERVRSCKIQGINIAQAAALPLLDLKQWLSNIENPLAVDIKKTLGTRIQALIDIGLDYISLDRGLSTLSGGEAQRCKIAKYLNSSLSDMLYILDEPSVGLHSHDIHRMLSAVKKLRDAGNTVVLVEHHKEMIKEADHIVDMGPEAGNEGGQVLFEGTYKELLDSGTKTGNLLKLAEHTTIKNTVRKPTGWYELRDVNYHNLKNVDVDLPKGVLTVIAGVAGSGKSSLMDSFCKMVPDAIYISQNNIGISLRSTPATYIGAADEIRKIFAKRCGQKPAMFSFNGKGKCPVCGGKGIIVSEMAFMDNIETTCEACNGLRYSSDVLAYEVDGMNIAQVMDLSVEKAIQWFEGTAVAKKLQPLMRVGLSYLHLNQALSTLSGGELQRMKLASYLRTEGEVFVLDEPTDGLHLCDIKNILNLFHEMVDAGNSMYLIEHNLEVLKNADYVVEIGPGGGNEGGKLLYAGIPEEIFACKDSVTAPYLKG